MVLGNKPISEIVDQDLINLIDNREEETSSIEFKREHYEGYSNTSENYKREICKDVTAMANAEGGYILIGVEAEDEIAQRFHDIPEADKKADSIYDICRKIITPSIIGLEVKPYKLSLQDEIFNLIIIHIPFSENRPHGFNSRGTLNFVKRYGETTIEYPMEEFIQVLFARYNLPSLDDIKVRLDRIENRTMAISDTTTILRQIGERLMQIGESE